MDSKGIKDCEEEDDVGALGAAVFFGNFGRIPTYDLRTNQTIRSRVRNGMMLFVSFHKGTKEWVVGICTIHFLPHDDTSPGGCQSRACRA